MSTHDFPCTILDDAGNKKGILRISMKGTQMSLLETPVKRGVPVLVASASVAQKTVFVCSARGPAEAFLVYFIAKKEGNEHVSFVGARVKGEAGSRRALVGILDICQSKPFVEEPRLFSPACLALGDVAGTKWDRNINCGFSLFMEKDNQVSFQLENTDGQYLMDKMTLPPGKEFTLQQVKQNDAGQEIFKIFFDGSCDGDAAKIAISIKGGVAERDLVYGAMTLARVSIVSRGSTKARR